MLRILVCDNEAGERLRLRNAFERVADELGLENLEIVLLPSLEQLEERVTASRADLYDMLVCRVESSERISEGNHAPTQAQEAFKVLARLREGSFEAAIVVISSSPQHAVDAIALEVAGMLPVSGTYETFKNTVSQPLKDIAAAHEGRVCVKSRQGLSNIALDHILFAESTKRGPLVHLPAGKTVLVPGTLQALFDRLSEDDRFAKAGSSFIVNLDNVRSLGERSVIFADGEAIVIPIRANKPLREALDTYRSR